MANAKKQDQLQALTEFISSSKNFAIVQFDKTTHITLENLRKSLRENDAKMKVVKNTLFEKAVNKLSKDDRNLTELRKKAFPLKENSALVALGQEWNKGLGAFHKFSEKETTVAFKMGYLDNQVYDKTSLAKIAQLPPREQLVAKVIGGMKSPLANTVYALKFNMQKLAYVLNAKASQG